MALAFTACPPSAASHEHLIRHNESLIIWYFSADILREVQYRAQITLLKNFPHITVCDEQVLREHIRNPIIHMFGTAGSNISAPSELFCHTLIQLFREGHIAASGRCPVCKCR